MVRTIMKLVRNRSFTLITGDSKQSRLRRLKNSVFQGSVLAHFFRHLYVRPAFHDSQNVAYADDPALLHSSGNRNDLEETLSQDMTTLSAHLQTRRLKLSHGKKVTATFYFRETKRELKVNNNSN